MLVDNIVKTMRFNVKLYENNPKWMPIKNNPTDAGFDLKAREVYEHRNGDLIKIDMLPHIFEQNRVYLVKTGVFLELTEGWEAQIRPRSGLALKHGITVVNSPGTIDASYRGEIAVIMTTNKSSLASFDSFAIKIGDRIAQMVIKEVPNITLTLCESVNETIRSGNGFGSSGV